jgi:hypothetical protein
MWAGKISIALAAGASRPDRAASHIGEDPRSKSTLR